MNRILAVLSALAFCCLLTGPAMADHHEGHEEAAAEAVTTDSEAGKAGGGCMEGGGCCGRVECVQAQLEAKKDGAGGGCPCKNKPKKDG